MTKASRDRLFSQDGAIRVAQLRLARNWSESGHLYAALSLYSQLLSRYPGSGVADAAAEELLELADRFEQQGHYYAALKLYRKVEELQ